MKSCFPRNTINYQKISGAGNDYNVDNNLRAWIFYLENIDNISMDETTATKLEVEIKIYIHLIILNQKIKRFIIHTSTKLIHVYSRGVLEERKT